MAKVNVFDIILKSLLISVGVFFIRWMHYGIGQRIAFDTKSQLLIDTVRDECKKRYPRDFFIRWFVPRLFESCVIFIERDNAYKQLMFGVARSYNARLTKERLKL